MNDSHIKICNTSFPNSRLDYSVVCFTFPIGIGISILPHLPTCFSPELSFLNQHICIYSSQAKSLGGILSPLIPSALRSQSNSKQALFIFLPSTYILHLTACTATTISLLNNLSTSPVHLPAPLSHFPLGSQSALIKPIRPCHSLSSNPPVPCLRNKVHIFYHEQLQGPLTWSQPNSPTSSLTLPTSPIPFRAH